MSGADRCDPTQNGHGSDQWRASWLQLALERPGPRYCRVTFDHPPINTVTATMVAELGELVGLIAEDPDLSVVVFASANPDVYLADEDGERDPDPLQPGPAGTNGWLDLLARLAGAPAVSIAAIRGRVGATGHEFVLACDLRFASRENTAVGPFPAAGGAGRWRGVAGLARLVGRARALEILLASDGCDGRRAEQYGYVNRAVADGHLEATVDALATRLACCDRATLARTKAALDQGDPRARSVR